jgi:ribosomal protein S18 acetylase RimI-like enzyme
MSLVVRQACAHDLEPLTELFDGYRQFYDQPSDLGRARRFLKARLSGADSVLLLAEDGAQALGFAQMFPSFSSLHTARLWILNDLFVAAGCRQRGAGRALLGACVEYARHSGAVALQLETQSTNTVAQALYTEQGWELDNAFCSYHYRLGESIEHT